MYTDLLNDYNSVMEKIHNEFHRKSEREQLKYIKIVSLVIFGIMIVGIILMQVKINEMLGLLLLLTGYLFLIAFLFIISRFEDKKEKHKKVEVRKHEELRKLLSSYGIRYDNKDDIDDLIGFYENRKKADNFLVQYFKPTGMAVKASVVSIGTLIISKIVEKNSDIVLLIRAMILWAFFVALFVLTYTMFVSTVRDWQYVKKYDDFIRDLRQVYLFRSRKLG